MRGKIKMIDPRDAKYFAEQDARQQYNDDYDKAESDLIDHLESSAMDLALEIIDGIDIPNDEISEDLHKRLTSAIAECLS